jgi:hypothetical protein
MSEVLRRLPVRLYRVLDGDDAEACMVLVVACSSRRAKSLGFKAFMGMFVVDSAELLLGLRVRMQRDGGGNPVVPVLPEGVYDGFDETSWMKLGYAAYEEDRACTPQEVADHSVYWCPGWRYDPENARKQLAMMKGVCIEK